MANPSTQIRKAQRRINRAWAKFCLYYGAAQHFGGAERHAKSDAARNRLMAAERAMALLLTA